MIQVPVLCHILIPHSYQCVLDWLSTDDRRNLRNLKLRSTFFLPHYILTLDELPIFSAKIRKWWQRKWLIIAHNMIHCAQTWLATLLPKLGTQPILDWWFSSYQSSYHSFCPIWWSSSYQISLKFYTRWKNGSFAVTLSFICLYILFVLLTFIILTDRMLELVCFFRFMKLVVVLEPVQGV